MTESESSALAERLFDARKAMILCGWSSETKRRHLISRSRKKRAAATAPGVIGAQGDARLPPSERLADTTSSRQTAIFTRQYIRRR